MAEQVRRALAWVYRNAASFGGDPERIYVGGQSSGAHLTAVALTTDWAGEYGLSVDPIRGALCASGMEQDPSLLPVAWERIHELWYNSVKGRNPKDSFGIYDTVRHDTVWLDKA